MHMLLCYLMIRCGLCREAPERRKFSLFFINTAEFLPYSRYRLFLLTTLGIDTNLQFVFSGIIILVAVMLDCLKYVQKK